MFSLFYMYIRRDVLNFCDIRDALLSTDGRPERHLVTRYVMSQFLVKVWLAGLCGFGFLGQKTGFTSNMHKCY